jgi:hypothetical protein
MKVNNKEYSIEKGEISVNVLENSELKPYGYTIERKYNSGWHTYWTNKIYSSLSSALNAIQQIPKGLHEEYRVVTLYRMTESQTREYKIKQIFGDIKSKEERLKEIKAWKLKDDFEYPKNRINKKGSIFIEFYNSIIKSGQSQKTEYYWNSEIKKHLSNKDLFELIELKDEKWLHPHLLKELKEKI